MAYKMKGSPFQRNFGIGSPVKKEGETTSVPNEAPKPPSGPSFAESVGQSGGEKAEKAMKTFKKIKRPTINMPKDHPVTPPTTEQSKESKGTVRGRTGFESDVVDPVKSKVRQGTHLLKDNIITNTVKKKVETDKRIIKKVKDYFTKR